MAFILASDDLGTMSLVVFSQLVNLLNNIKVKDIVEIRGRVTKRFDKYQINVSNIIKK
jgi:uncharacterized protein YdeI (BOF family)